jgi:hypothetical protein
MYLKIFAVIWFAALAAAPITLSADAGAPAQPVACCEQPAAGCCDKQPCAMPCCEGADGCDMPCCDQHAAHDAADVGEPDAIAMLLAMDPNAIWSLAAEAAPIRQSTVAWFHRPVWVGNTVLMGKYVIEHDTDRQARGEPCTHIYAADDMTVPVAVFHCTHLDRNPVPKNTVVLQSLSDGSQKLLEFQFAGEQAAHGFPTER